MRKGKYPIIANGELYVESVMKKSGPNNKKYPHEYNEAKANVFRDLKDIEEKIRTNEEVFMEERVLCVRLEPSFEAKSYIPGSLLLTEDMKIIGGRRYVCTNNDAQEESAKLYFIKTKDFGIQKLKRTLELGTKDSIESWQNQIRSIKNINLLTGDEKAQGFSKDWTEGKIEIILHPIQKNPEEMINIFLEVSGFHRDEVKMKSYENGLTFISATCSKDKIANIKKFNPLRAIHPLGDIELDPFRMMQEVPGPQPARKKMKSNIKVGVFDGGVNEEHPLLNGYVKANEVVDVSATKTSLKHGNGVCGAVLHGHLGGKTPKDVLENPAVFVESFRVLPTNTEITSTRGAEEIYGMYDTIDQIEAIVEKRKDIKLFNLSFGPKEPILDDSISRFTYALDRLTYKVGEGEDNPLFCVAVGNDGDKGEYFDRIQTPSDMVNGLAVGAYTFNMLNEKIRAVYSSIGPGREGAKIKPDILEFGGCQERPFVVVGTNKQMVGIDAGTSFAAPVATGKVGRLMAQSQTICPHLGRTLLIHNAKLDNGIRNDECGYGFDEENVGEILKCDDKRITILYEGELPAASTIKLPVYSPGVSQSSGKVKITWTITTIVNPDITDTDAYTNNCIEDTFYPHSTRFNFTKGKHTVKLNLSNPEESEKVKELLEQGYKMSSLPLSAAAKKDANEAALRNSDLKWDTVIRKEKSMFATSLLNPFLTLHAMGRNGFEHETIKYFVAITVEALGYKGNLYDNVLQTYTNLVPIEIHNINRVMVPID
jgi:hypothetical protein